MNKYPHLFQPLTVKTMYLRNRTVMPPIGTNFAGLGGEMKDDHISYYAQRAKGGVGLIILENVCVDYPSGTNGTTQLRIDNDQYLPGLFRFTEAMRSYGACTSVQLNHAGASASPLRMEQQVVSSSNIPSKTGGTVPRPLRKFEIARIAEKFGEAAARAKRAGFDAVEVHMGHSYLLSQFLSPIYNKRSDEFGGSIENRVRFPRMVLEEVRKAVGPMFPVGIRVSADEMMAGGNTLDDTNNILKLLVDKVEIINVSAALNDTLQFQIDKMSLPDGWRSFMAAGVKKKFPDKVVITTGNIRDPQVAENILAKGEADLIGMGRGLIAEPNWVDKVAHGEEHMLRKCISCNIGCADHRIGRARPIRCTVNPDLFFEDAYKDVDLEYTPKVLVIGGGLAGMEAAATAAEMGCPTVLLEKSGQLGGLGCKISQIPEKKRIFDFVKYMRTRVESLKNLEIRLNGEADMATLKNIEPDIIIVATGSQPLLPPIPGLGDNLDQPNGHVHSIIDFLDNIGKFKDPGKRYVIVGGGAVGLDVVEYFVNLGAKNTAVVEMADAVGRDVDFISKIDLNALLNGPNGPEIFTSTMLKEVKPDRFIVEKDGKQIEMPFDHGFICLGMSAYKPLDEELTAYSLETGTKLIRVGDRKVARRIIDGVKEGRDIQNAIKRFSQRKSREARVC